MKGRTYQPTICYDKIMTNNDKVSIRFRWPFTGKKKKKNVNGLNNFITILCAL